MQFTNIFQSGFFHFISDPETRLILDLSINIIFVFISISKKNKIIFRPTETLDPVRVLFKTGKQFFKDGLIRILVILVIFLYMESSAYTLRIY